MMSHPSRRPSVVSILTRANDTMDSRISTSQAVPLAMDHVQADFNNCDDDPTYSSIPDNVFRTPQTASTVAYVRYDPTFDDDDSSFLASPISPHMLPVPLQRCESTPNPLRCSQAVSQERLRSGRIEDNCLKRFENNITPLCKSGNVLKTRTAPRIATTEAKFNLINNLGVPVVEKNSRELQESLMEDMLSGVIPDDEVIRNNRRFLLDLSVKRGLLGLMAACEKSYIDSLDISNCLEVLKIFHNLLPQSKSKQIVMRFIRKNLTLVSSSREWNQLRRHDPLLFEEIVPVEKTWII